MTHRTEKRPASTCVFTDTFCYYIGAVDNSQQATDAATVRTLLGSVHKKFGPVATELLAVLRAFDASGGGYLSQHDVLSGCAALGVVVSESELQSLLPMLKTNAAGQIDYAHLCSIFSS